MKMKKNLLHKVSPAVLQVAVVAHPELVQKRPDGQQTFPTGH